MFTVERVQARQAHYHDSAYEARSATIAAGGRRFVEYPDLYF